MKETERAVIVGLAVFLLILALGFLIHRSPRFAGTLGAGILAVTGALFMLSGLLYAAVKRIPPLKATVTRRVPMRTLLAWHVYTGILGAILALLHTGHLFSSTLGIALTIAMLIAVFTGVVGRYFYNQISMELREKEQMLASLRQAYEQASQELSQRAVTAGASVVPSGFLSRFAAAFFMPEVEGAHGEMSLSYRTVRVAESMADLEYAVKTHEVLKQRCSRWLKLHIASAVLFYVLLAFHIWAGVFFGLRWFS